MLINSYSNLIECGTDEVGRCCLAGPVTAAAVILPKDFKNKELTDSKKLSKKKREVLRKIIIEEAIDYSVIHVDVKTIDEINILNASILAMHRGQQKHLHLYSLPLGQHWYLQMKCYCCSSCSATTQKHCNWLMDWFQQIVHHQENRQ